ncbi:MAG: efflux RND transporter permease subunit, partial [Thermostichus sp. DG02_4_bins_136]
VSLIFNELILTISFAVAGSLVVGLTVVPMLTSRLLTVRRRSGFKQWPLIRRFQQGVIHGTYAYQRLLGRLLLRPGLLILVAFLFLGGGSYWMAGQLNQELLPRISTGQVNLSANFARDTTLATNYRIMEEVDRILLQQPEVEYVFTTAGGSAFGGSTFANPLRGTSTITLKPGTAVGPFVDRVNGLMNQLNLVGSRIRVSPGGLRGLSTRNSAVNAEVDVVLQGEDGQALQAASRLVLQALDEQASLSTFRPEADDNQPEVQIWPDWERATPLRLSTQDMGRVVQTAVQGSVPTQLQQGNRLLDVRVQLKGGGITQPSQLERLPLFVQNGQTVRLGDVARLEMAQTRGEIRRLNQRQVVILNGSLTAGANQSAAIDEVDAIFSNLQLPAGITRLPSQALATNRQLRYNLLLLGSLAAFLVFVVMAVQYNSLIDPLVIMLTVPLALSGGILGLFLTQIAVGATVLVGAVLLVGIVVNNAILMVELANQLRQTQGLDYRSAILNAAPQRLRPILMTTVTTVLGLFPLALGWGEGSELLQPLGVVVFSGLSLATLLTLFVIPCFYVLLHGAGEATPSPPFPDLAPLQSPAIPLTPGK